MNNDINEKIVHAAPVPPFVRFVASAVPMVFDNSLSYYEALCALWKWMQDNLVDVINHNASVTEDYIKLTDALKDYVENYFANLDVQEEINNKLDEMVRDGSFQTILNTYVQPKLDELEDDLRGDITDVSTNLTNAIGREAISRSTADAELQSQINGLASGAPLVASSVSQMTDTTKIYVNTSDGYWYYYDGNSWEQGGVYQASIDPDDLTEVKNDLTLITQNAVAHTWVANKRIDTTGPVDVNTLVVNSAYNCIVVDCSAGDKFTITGRGGGNNWALWTFIDSNGVVLSQAKYEEISTDKVIAAPTNSAKLVCNIKNAYTYYLIIGEYLKLYLDKLSYDTNAKFTLKSGYIRDDTGGINSSTIYKYGVIPTVPNQKIIYNAGFNANSLVSLGFYRADGSFISGESIIAKNYDQAKTTPAGAYIIKATLGDATHTGYIKYASDESVVSKLGELGELAEKAWKIPKLVLPTESIAVIGHEWNMYYENVIYGLTDEYYVKCRCSSITSMNAHALSDCLRFTPSAGTAGDKTVTIEIHSKRTGALIDSGSFNLKVIADKTLTGKNVIFIGDSLTDDGVYPAEIQYNLSNNGITSLGTITETVNIEGNSYTISHEGRGGWSAGDYVTQARVSGVNNPFFNPVTETFDFSYYMTNAGFPSVDVVSIYLGTNADPTIDDTINYLDTMIESIHEYNPNVKILINTMHESAGQDGCGNHNQLQNAQEMRNDRLNKTSRILEEYTTGHANVYPTTLYFNVDGEHDYATVVQPLSSRNPNTIVRQNNNVHPSVYGYLKFADVIYNKMIDLL